MADSLSQGSGFPCLSAMMVTGRYSFNEWKRLSLLALRIREGVGSSSGPLHSVALETAATTDRVRSKT